jgi:hypothetical protein
LGMMMVRWVCGAQENSRLITRNAETSPVSPILPTNDLRNSRSPEVLTFVF